MEAHLYKYCTLDNKHQHSAVPSHIRFAEHSPPCSPIAETHASDVSAAQENDSSVAQLVFRDASVSQSVVSRPVLPPDLRWHVGDTEKVNFPANTLFDPVPLDRSREPAKNVTAVARIPLLQGIEGRPVQSKAQMTTSSVCYIHEPPSDASFYAVFRQESRNSTIRMQNSWRRDSERRARFVGGVRGQTAVDNALRSAAWRVRAERDRDRIEFDHEMPLREALICLERNERNALLSSLQQGIMQYRIDSFARAECAARRDLESRLFLQFNKMILVFAAQLEWNIFCDRIVLKERQNRALLSDDERVAFKDLCRHFFDGSWDVQFRMTFAAEANARSALLKECEAKWKQFVSWHECGTLKAEEKRAVREATERLEKSIQNLLRAEECARMKLVDDENSNFGFLGISLSNTIRAQRHRELLEREQEICNEQRRRLAMLGESEGRHLLTEMQRAWHDLRSQEQCDRHTVQRQTLCRTEKRSREDLQACMDLQVAEWADQLSRDAIEARAKQQRRLSLVFQQQIDNLIRTEAAARAEIVVLSGGNAWSDILRQAHGNRQQIYAREFLSKSADGQLELDKGEETFRGTIVQEERVSRDALERLMQLETARQKLLSVCIIGRKELLDSERLVLSGVVESMKREREKALAAQQLYEENLEKMRALLELRETCRRDAAPFAGLSLMERVFDRHGYHKEFPLVVDALYVGGPAHRAGIQLNDIVTAISSRPVLSLNDVRDAFRLAKVGSSVKVSLCRREKNERDEKSSPAHSSANTSPGSASLDPSGVFIDCIVDLLTAEAKYASIEDWYFETKKHERIVRQPDPEESTVPRRHLRAPAVAKPKSRQSSRKGSLV